MTSSVMPAVQDLQAESRPVSRFSGRRIHFIGIGGCGMSGLARMLMDAGAIVTGSDPKPNEQTCELAQHGASISHDQTGQLLTADTDLVVRSAAVPDSNPEFQAAGRLRIRHMKYAQLLGEVMQERFGVAVSGTHGKSTTSAMTAYGLTQCGGDPSFVIGGTIPQLGGGSRSGVGQAFVVEACEFDRSFHNLHPRVALITNIEEDHLDCYKGGITEIVESFRQFARLVPEDGLIIANGQDARVRQALAGLSTPTQWVGLQPNPATGSGRCPHLCWKTRVIGAEEGCYRGEVFRGRKCVATLQLSVAGRHNLFNATMAVAACAACGIDPARAAEAIGRFTGVARRMAQVGRCNGAVVVDDYGHHPTEIRTTLKAVREKYNPKRLFCVFQPHQHSRTRFLLDDFARSFTLADETIIPDIYFVRDSESEKQLVGAADLVQRIQQNGQKARYLPQFAQIVEHLRNEAREDDVILTMGAGNVWEIGRDLVK